METLTITTIIWLAALGAITGWIVGSIVNHEGVTVESNVIWGIIGSVCIGFIFLLLELSGVLLYGFIGTLGILFIVNIFHLHHIEEIYEESDMARKSPKPKI